MRPPGGLGNSGRALWRSIVKGLPDGWELDEREQAILKLAARQVDAVAQLEGVVAKQGAMVRGSTGQPVVHPAVVEARQGRVVVSRLLGQLALPNAEQEPQAASGRRAQHAAVSRWQEEPLRREGHRGA